MTNGWYRIIGNAGTAFFTTLAGVSLVGVPAEQAWSAAMVPAIIAAGLSFCKELSLLGGDIGKSLKYVTLF